MIENRITAVSGAFVPPHSVLLRASHEAITFARHGMTNEQPHILFPVPFISLLLSRIHALEVCKAHPLSINAHAIVQIR
jgi:hypothetical protein